MNQGSLSPTARPVYIATAAGAVLSAATVALLWLGRLPLGVPGQWEWLARDAPVLPGPGFLAALLALGLALAAVLYACEHEKSRMAPAVAVILCTVASGVALVGFAWDDDAAPVAITTSTMSIAALGYYGQAAETPDLREGLRHFTTTVSREGISDRVRTHPPGPVVAFWLARRAVAANTALTAWGEQLLQRWCGLGAREIHGFARYFSSPLLTPGDVPVAFVCGLLITLAAMLVPPAAFLLGWGTADVRTGVIAALLSAAIPSLLVFIPSIEGMVAALAITALGCWAAGIRTGAWPWFVGGGIAAVLALLWSAGVAILAIPAAAMAVAMVRQDRGTEAGSVEAAGASRRVLGGTVIVLAVVFGLLGALFVATGYSYAANFLVISRVQAEIMERVYRSYLVWIPFNFYDTILFMGPALAAVGAAACRLVRTLPAPVSGLVWGLMLCLAVLLVSGTTRGEVGRIWLLVMPPAAVAAAFLAGRLSPRQQARTLPIIVAAQFIVAWSFSAVLLLVHP